jgi:hypothetical protein
MRAAAIHIRHTAVPVLAFVMVVAVAIVPSTHSFDIIRALIGPGSIAVWLAMGGAALAVGALVLWRSRLTRTGLRLACGRGGKLILHLWPVVTLTTVYPVASRRMAGHEVGGVALTTFLLAVALTLPWLLQGVCMPLYRAIGDLVNAGDDHALRRGFVAAMPGAVVQSIPFILISGLPLILFLHWSPAAVGTFYLLMVVQVLFAQSLVLANVTRYRLGWVWGWSAYAITIMVVPTWYWLPPIAGLLTQLVPLRRQLLTRPAWLDLRGVLTDVPPGLLLGVVMWGDKLFYFYHSRGNLPVIILFIASLPAIIAYNFYFVCRSPDFESSVKRLHEALMNEPLLGLRKQSGRVFETAQRSLRDTAFIGAILVGATAVLLWSLAAPPQAALIGGVAAVSWLCAVISIACYKLEYVNDRRGTCLVGGLHLAICVGLFASPLAAADIYVGIVCGDIVALILALALFRRAWRTPEHTLFWRRALAW